MLQLFLRILTENLSNANVRQKVELKLYFASVLSTAIAEDVEVGTQVGQAGFHIYDPIARSSPIELNPIPANDVFSSVSSGPEINCELMRNDLPIHSGCGDANVPYYAEVRFDIDPVSD